MQSPDYVLDTKRLAALSDLDILDTPAEPGFDDIVELAAQICETPVALVSLVTADRQWFKARVGFAGCETPLGVSICVHALGEQDLLVIPDLTRDPRTADNPLVTEEPHIRFYAGAPLRTPDGHVLGTLCVLDGTARPEGLTAAQASGLMNLGRQVMSQLALRRALADRDLLLAAEREAEVRRNGLLSLGDRLRDLGSVPEMTRAASEVIGLTLRASRAAFGRLDGDGEHIEFEPDWTAPGVASIAGRHKFSDYGDLARGLVAGEALVIEDVLTDSRTAASHDPLTRLGIRALVSIPVREQGRTVAAVIVHAGEPRGWNPETLVFLRNVADRLEAAVARLRAEAGQRILNMELSHRMKNTMAMVQAIANQTLRSVPDQAPVRVFEDRILALSKAHDVLLEQNWSEAKMAAVVASVLGTFGDAGRLSLSGPEVRLGPRAALSLSLLLHELGTNAVKYGALSRDEGRIQVTWRLQESEAEPDVVLDWREAGGPAVSEPVKTGFGSRLIAMGLVGTGGVDLRWARSGFAAEFRAPLSQLQLS